MSNLLGFMFRYKSDFLWYLFLIRLGFALGIMPRMDIYFDAETWDASASCTVGLSVCLFNSLPLSDGLLLERGVHVQRPPRLL